jgi:hypothetical protein
VIALLMIWCKRMRLNISGHWREWKKRWSSFISSCFHMFYFELCFNLNFVVLFSRSTIVVNIVINLVYFYLILSYSFRSSHKNTIRIEEACIDRR